MGKAMFLYKEKDGRKDAVYIERACFECGHYFSYGDLVGAGWSGRELKVSKEWYNNIETILTYDEMKLLEKKRKELNDLGYGLDTKEDKKQEGYAIIKELEDTIYKKLLSAENEELFEKIKEEEIIDFAESNTWGLDKEDIEEIFNAFEENYGHKYPYQDRDIISAVYKDKEEMAEEYVYNCYNVDDFIRNYIDYEKMADDLLEDSDYYELSNGKVVRFMI